MNGADFISISAVVVTHGEAGSRSATSRAYYGAFHLLLELLEDFGCRLSHRTSHKTPLDCLEYATHESGKSVKIALGNLQGRRVKADYHFDEVAANTPEYGQYSISQARKIQTLILQFREACDANPQMKKEFCEAVQAYIKRAAR
jgi:hypothetical protein